MIGNYLTVALRNMVRHKLYSVITVAGLAMGLACVIFITLFIRDELSFDGWLPGSDTLYRIHVSGQLPGRPVDRFAQSPFPLPGFMKDHLPEVTAVTHLWPVSMTVLLDDKQFREEVNEVDTNFFAMMKLPLTAGDPGQVLQRPESIVLSQTLARKYFGDANPVGRHMVINRPNCGKEFAACPQAGASLIVTGVMRDLPHNTQFKINAVIPHNSPVDRITEHGKKAWFSINGYGYVRLAQGADPAAVTAKLGRVMDRMLDFSDDTGVQAPASKVMLVDLMRFRDVHMNTADMLGSRVPSGSWPTVYGLILIGVVILLAACFNFTNLATARALMRAREIGLRKCVGASRAQVAIQFLGESVLVAIVSLVVALSAVEVLLPAYDTFLGRPILLQYAADWPILILILAITVGAGLLSGLYPALVLSGFRPVTALRSKSGQAGSGGLRNVLVVLQFAVSIGLGTATLVVFAQIDHARAQVLGFRHDNVVTIETGRRMSATARDSFMALLRSYPGIAAVGASSQVPFSPGLNVANVILPGHAAPLTVEQTLVTPEFLELYGMKLAAGRMPTDRRAEDAMSYDDDSKNDGHGLLINEAAARYFGFGVHGAIGKSLKVNKSNVHVIGILKDVHFKGARQGVPPTIFLNDKGNSSLISVRLTGTDMSGTLGFIDRTWRRIAPSTAISRNFLDDSFEELYQSDRKQGEMFGIFVGIAIFISCLGLFGLAAFTAGRRTREIGIRKVFGARTRDVALLLLWQFSVPVLLANLIAWPLAWYYLRGWLQGFAYRIELSPTYFLAAGMAAILIAWGTILGHALRVARANPIHALRAE